MTYKSYFFILALLLCTTIARAQYNQVNDIPYRDSTLNQPNGLIGTADGKLLYVAEVKANRILKYDIQTDGTLANRQVFTNMGSDGMTIDDRGNIYLTGDGVTVFDKNGRKIAHFPIPEDWTSNVCFDGKERNILFITASKSVYILKMLVHGVNI